MKIIAEDGNTPISDDELAELKPSLSTKEELNEWEAQNILGAATWALDPKNVAGENPVSEPYLRELHRRMFDQTWKWAGKYRLSEKNIGVLVHEIQQRLGELLGDVRYWIDHKTYHADEIAIRFHHRLVAIHPFPNGNGRHARLIADILISKLGGKPFSWGNKDLVKEGQPRTEYLDAIRAADKGHYGPLLQFARS
jgi:Fic-DOC domain mobile mystery protein B